MQQDALDVGDPAAGGARGEAADQPHRRGDGDGDHDDDDQCADRRRSRRPSRGDRRASRTPRSTCCGTPTPAGRRARRRPPPTAPANPTLLVPRRATVRERASGASPHGAACVSERTGSHVSTLLVRANFRGARRRRAVVFVADAAAVRHRHAPDPTAGHAPARRGRDLPVRADGLWPAAHRPRAGDHGVRRARPLPAMAGPARPAGLQRHRHRRRHHRSGQPRGPSVAGDHGALRAGLVPGDGRDQRRPARCHTARHGLRRRHGGDDRATGRRRQGLRDGRRCLPGRRRGARLRLAGPPGPRRPGRRRRRPGRRRRRAQAAPGRLRALEAGQAGRAVVAVAVG